ncbi:MAG TPA: mechanosensitive ion channel [Rhodocyclaceae bacterium]|nr:mechanosensitive ion channel [Rhodocyclaceae bacterium]HRQ47508.1 mechanosensitive ion channel [Rhodocyclaceae bacterium]
MDPVASLYQPDFVNLYVIPWTIRIVTAAAIWVIGKWIAEKLTGVIRKVMGRAGLDIMLVQFLGNIVNVVLLVVVIIAALDSLGVPTTSMLAVFGAAGLAVALALKDSLGNLASGVMLITIRPFRVGDFIEAGGISGVPEEIRIFSTVMRTPDNRQIIVPNGQIANGVIINYNAKPTRRLDLVFGISYDDDIRKAKAIIERIIGENERILKDPAPLVAVGELADSSVNINVRPWVNTEDFWTVRAELLENIKIAFDAEGITIPFPQRDVHIHETKLAA